LLETKVCVSCKEEDRELVESILPAAKKEFEEFLLTNTGKTVDIELTMQNKNLEKGECSVGGIVLYCRDNNIVFRNTLDARLELCFMESAPALRAGLFPTDN